MNNELNEYVHGRYKPLKKKEKESCRLTNSNKEERKALRQRQRQSQWRRKTKKRRERAKGKVEWCLMQGWALNYSNALHNCQTALSTICVYCVCILWFNSHSLRQYHIPYIQQTCQLSSKVELVVRLLACLLGGRMDPSYSSCEYWVVIVVVPWTMAPSLLPPPMSHHTSINPLYPCIPTILIPIISVSQGCRILWICGKGRREHNYVHSIKHLGQWWYIAIANCHHCLKDNHIRTAMWSDKSNIRFLFVQN